jgi:hypothetical protein
MGTQLVRSPASLPAEVVQVDGWFQLKTAPRLTLADDDQVPAEMCRQRHWPLGITAGEVRAAFRRGGYPSSWPFPVEGLTGYSLESARRCLAPPAPPHAALVAPTVAALPAPAAAPRRRAPDTYRDSARMKP